MFIDASEAFIQTPMVQELHDTVRRWTLCGFTGGVIVGEARLGKTWAIQALGNELRTPEDESIKLFHIGFGQRDVQTIRSVYVRIARAIGNCTIKNAMTADQLEDFLFHAFAEAALSNQRRQVVLLVDEAQELTIHQLAVFAEIFNDQDRIKNRLIIYFVANTQKFQPLAKLLMDDENRYLRERFFHNIHKFYGIRSCEELRACLAFFDHYWIDPEKKISLVEHYCPAMVKEGFSLVDLADPIWAIYDEHYAAPLAMPSWGMTYFQRAINILLMDYLSHHWHNDPETIDALIEKSIAASGIVPSLKSIA